MNDVPAGTPLRIRLLWAKFVSRTSKLSVRLSHSLSTFFFYCNDNRKNKWWTFSSCLQIAQGVARAKLRCQRERHNGEAILWLKREREDLEETQAIPKFWLPNVWNLQKNDETVVVLACCKHMLPEKSETDFRALPVIPSRTTRTPNHQVLCIVAFGRGRLIYKQKASKQTKGASI